MNRPTAVTVFAVLNLAFGILGVCSAPASIIAMRFSPTPEQSPYAAVDFSGPFGPWFQASVVLSFVLSIALIAAGFGLLQLAPWARKLSIYYAVAAIALAIVGGVINVFVIRDFMARSAATPGEAGAAMGYVMGSLGSCMGLVYPTLLLLFMTRPKVKAAFAPQAIGAEFEQPDEPL